MNKVHFDPAQNPETLIAACGRQASITSNSVSAVTCLNCQKQPEFVGAQVAVAVAKAEAFANQEPHQVKNPWNNQPIQCSECGHALFRDNGRSLDTYNHVCAQCGTTNHTMTETGMSA